MDIQNIDCIREPSRVSSHFNPTNYIQHMSWTLLYKRITYLYISTENYIQHAIYSANIYLYIIYIVNQLLLLNWFISINRANSTLYIYHSTLTVPVSHSRTSSLTPWSCIEDLCLLQAHYIRHNIRHTSLYDRTVPNTKRSSFF